ncbi:DMT family transporter, partial [Streptomyces sp. NPDC057621]|uniref:EamA family transporter n=1 Tax=Streptomyces sp. NPDC057621 TaxID=3346186 RepID=UPI003686F9B8
MPAASAPSPSPSPTSAPAPAPAPASTQHAPAALTTPAPEGGRLAALLTLLGSGLSNQTGAAIGSLAFPVLGPLGVVAVRQYVAAIALFAVARPPLRSFTRHQWWPVLLLALVFGTMNLSLYTAIDRIGLGLAVTLEFLGPLAIALSAARRRIDACCALVAAAGVVTLMRPQPSADYLGMGLGLLAAVCWASYILLN